MAKIDENGKGLAFLFIRFSPFFQLFKNASKTPKTTLGVVENNSRVFSLCFWCVFKKLKKWPKFTKMVRGLPLLFAQFLLFFQLLENGSKRPKMTLEVVENDSKAFSLFFWTVFKQLKKWPKSTKMVRVSLYFLLKFCRFLKFLKTFQKGLKWH